MTKFVVNISSSRTFYVFDTISKERLLVDTGAPCSIWHVKLVKEKPICSNAVNQPDVRASGEISKTLNLILQREFQWIFILADLLLSNFRDRFFLLHFGLLVEVRNKELKNSTTLLSVQGMYCKRKTVSPCSDNKYTILEKYLEITKPWNQNRECVHNVKHQITTKSPPVFSNPRRLSPEKLKAAKEEFHHMLDLGTIRLSSSKLDEKKIVEKKNTEENKIFDWRPCGDFR